MVLLIDIDLGILDFDERVFFNLFICCTMFYIVHVNELFVNSMTLFSAQVKNVDLKSDI